MAGYFHTVRSQSSPAVATLVLADTLYLLGHRSSEHRVGPGLEALLSSAVDAFVRVKRVSGDTPGQSSQADALRRQADDLGLATDRHSSFASGLPEYLDRRDALLSACRDDGWNTSPRTGVLYD